MHGNLDSTLRLANKTATTIDLGRLDARAYSLGLCKSRDSSVPPPWFTAPPPADRDGAESHRETSRQRRAGTRGPELSDQAHSNVLNCGLSSWRRRRALTQRLLPTAAAEPHRVHRKPGASEQQFAHTELACQPVRLGGERSFHARQAVVIRVPLPCHWAACVALWRSHCHVFLRHVVCGRCLSCWTVSGLTALRAWSMRWGGAQAQLAAGPAEPAEARVLQRGTEQHRLRRRR